MKTDCIAFRNTIISGRGQNVLSQAIGFEFFDKNLSANLPTNLLQMAYAESIKWISLSLSFLQ